MINPGALVLFWIIVFSVLLFIPLTIAFFLISRSARSSVSKGIFTLMGWGMLVITLLVAAWGYSLS